MNESISSPDCRSISGWCPAWTAVFHRLLLAMLCLGAPALAPAQTDEVPQGEPYNLAAIRIFDKSVTLSWSDNTSNETGFRIVRKPAAGGAETVFTAPANTTLYTIAGLAVAAGTAYQYSVQAVNESAAARGPGSNGTVSALSDR